MTKKSNINGKYTAIYERKYPKPGSLLGNKSPSQADVSNNTENEIARIG